MEKDNVGGSLLLLLCCYYYKSDAVAVSGIARPIWFPILESDLPDYPAVVAESPLEEAVTTTIE